MARYINHILIHLGSGLVLFLYLLYSQYGVHIPWNELWIMLGGVVTVSIFYSLLSLSLSRWLDQKISWNALPGWRLAAAFSMNYLLASGIVLIIGGVYLMIQGKGILDFVSSYREIFIKLFLLLFIIIFVIQLIELGIQAFRHHHQQKLQKIAVEQEHIHTQFEILRTQLNPHFLFNCLNTISALLYRSPEEAEQFIRSFAQLNQRILSTQKQELVNIHNEIKLAQLYLSLMKVRYGDALIVNINLPDEPINYYLPPLSLQILLENAIKHNAISTKTPLVIDIAYVGDDHLLVQNNKLPLKQKPTSFAMGLDLLKKRYAFFTHQQIQITNTETTFAATLPLLAN